MSKLYNPDTYCWYAYSAYDSNHKWCCCVGQGNLENFAAVNQDATIQQIRHDLKHGIKNPECWRCWVPESRGETSNRQVGMQWIEPTMPDGNYYDPKFRALWLDSGTVCNLACRTCNSIWSSAHLREHKDRWGNKKLPIVQRTDLDYLLQEDYRDIFHIVVIGGEPLLNLQHVAVLEKIVADGHAGQCKVTYLTNGTLPIPPRLAAIIPHFKAVNFMISVDGVGPSFEYTRTGAQWPAFEKNVQAIKAGLPPNAMMFFKVTVSVLNVLRLPEIMTWAVQHIGPPDLAIPDRVAAVRQYGHLDLSAVLTPSWWSFSVLTDAQKAKVIEHVKSSPYPLPAIVNALQACTYSPADAAQFHEEVAWTHQYRQMSLEQYLPELHDILQS